ncbi:MAG: CocE/NonD family hydrolase [Pseudomonadota bacterium]
MLALCAGAESDTRAMVAMGDGTRLETFVHLPDTVPAPVVLLRTPYRFPGAGVAYHDAFAAALTDRGYAFVVQNLRGRFGSDGVFDPFRNAVADGGDTVRWILAQPWSNGRVGTVGGSYNGYTALAAAAGAPQVQAVVADDPALDLWAGHRGGALGLLPAFWLYLLDHGRWPDEAAKAAASDMPDHGQIDKAVLGRDDPFWEAYLAGGTGSTDRSLRPELSNICAPVLTLKSKSEGWEDPVDLWRALRRTGCPAHRGDHQLIVTAQAHTHHLDQLATGGTDVTARLIGWLDRWLRDAPAQAMPPVLYRPDGAEGFRGADDWPVRGSETVFYLGQRFSMVGNAHLVGAPASGLRRHVLNVDPATLSPCAVYPRRTYLSPPLEDDILLAGPMRLELFLRATTGAAGLSVQVYDYDAGRDVPLSFVTFAVARADGLAAETATQLTLETHSVSHRFRAGTRIALSLGGSACGYGEVGHPAGAYELLYGTDAPSRLVFEAVAE